MTVHDYSEHIIRAARCITRAEQALSELDTGSAKYWAMESIVAARGVVTYCNDRLEKENG